MERLPCWPFEISLMSSAGGPRLLLRRLVLGGLRLEILGQGEQRRLTTQLLAHQSSRGDGAVHFKFGAIRRIEQFGGQVALQQAVHRVQVLAAAEFAEVAEVIAAVLKPNPDIAALRARTKKLADAFPLYSGLENW